MLCNSANLGLVPQSSYFDRDIANSENTDGYYVISPGDFVYNPRKSTTAPYGPVNIYTGVGKGIISPLYLCFKVNGINPTFLYHFFKSATWYPYMYSHGDSGARFDRVSIKDETFFALPFCIPSIKEQEKISYLLNLLDERIATQNKIIEKLQSLIKGLNDFLYNSLQSNDICKIGDYCQFYSGGTPPSANPNYYGGTIPFIRSGEIKKNFTELLITEDGLNNSAAKLIHKGDILIAMYGATSGEISIAQIDGAINQAILCVKTTLNPYFFMAIWERMKNSILTKYLQGGQGNLSANIIKNISVPIPSNIIQNTISNIYRQLEKRLSMESELLSLLQKQKRYFLRQMFI